MAIKLAKHTSPALCVELLAVLIRVAIDCARSTTVTQIVCDARVGRIFYTDLLRKVEVSVLFADQSMASQSKSELQIKGYTLKHRLSRLFH